MARSGAYVAAVQASRCRKTRQPRRRRRAFTLLEVILALALTAVTLTLMSMAIQVNLAVANKSRATVEEAQLARALLLRIAEDIRNTVPFQPPPGSQASLAADAQNASSGSASTASGSAAAASGSAAASSAASSSSGSSSGSSGTFDLSTTANSTIPISGGLSGDLHDVQIETSRRPRVAKATLIALENGTQQTSLSDLRVVGYSLGPPGGGGPSSGLYRSEVDRLEYYAAMQQGGQSAAPSSSVNFPDAPPEQLAAEVVDLKFTYYSGTTPNDTWDSIQQGALPSAVRVTLTLRSNTQSSSGLSLFNGVSTTTSTNDRPVSVYDILVDLPNAAVPASEFQQQPSDDVGSAAAGSSGANPSRAGYTGGRGNNQGRGGQNGQGNGRGRGQGGQGRGRGGQGRGRGGQGGAGQGRGGQGRAGQGRGGQGNGAGEGGRGQGEGGRAGRGQGRGENGQGRGENGQGGPPGGRAGGFRGGQGGANGGFGPGGQGGFQGGGG